MAEATSDTPNDADSTSDYDDTAIHEHSGAHSGESWAEEESEYSEASEAIDDVTVADRKPVDKTAIVESEQDRAQALRSARRYKVAVFALLAIAGLLTLAAAVRFWLPPWIPLAAFAVLGVGPLFFWACVGALIFDPTKTREGLVGKDSPPLAQRLKLALTPVLGAALIGSAIAALWFIAPLRGVVVSISADQRLAATLDGALGDEDADVRLAACEGLRELKDDTSARLLGSLRDPSEAVVDCALDALPAQPIAAPQLASAAMTWQQDLVQTPAPQMTGERACLLSNRVRIAERKGLRHAPMQLMACALDATSAPARECCAQSFRAMLGGNDIDPPMVVGSTVDLVHGGFYRTVPSLLKATHSKDPEWEKKRMSLRLDSPSSRAWSMALACESLGMGGAQLRQPISEAMAAAVSSAECRIGPAQETTVRLWTAVCSQLFTTESIASADGTESDKFCSAINGTMVVDASNEARRISQEALRTARQPERQKQMMRMLLDYSSRVARATMGEDSGDIMPSEELLFGTPTPGKRHRSAKRNGMLGEMMKMFGDPTPPGRRERSDDGAGMDTPEAMMKMLMDQGVMPEPPGFDD